MLSRRARIALGVPILLAGVVYFNALDNPFVYDDQRLILENRSIEPPLQLRALFIRDSARPLVNFSYAVDRAVWGPGPFGFHLTNVLLHGANVGLLFLLAWTALSDRRRLVVDGVRGPSPEVAAGAAAVLYAIHPLMTQAVGYVSGRAEVLVTTWLLLALLSARAWFQSNRVRWLAATAALWAAGLATKETAVMLPVALLAFDRLLCPSPGDAGRRRVLWLHLPFFTTAVLAGSLRLGVMALLERGGPLAPQASLALVELDVVRRYLGLLVMPSMQSIFHPVAPVTGIFDPRVLVAAVVIGVAVFAAWTLRRREPLAAFGICWFFLMLVPSSALVVLDRGEPMAEHRVYAAAAGFFLAAGAAAAHLAVRIRRARRVTRWTLVAASGVILVSLGGKTMLRNATWGDPVALWTEAVSGAPEHWLPNLALGEALQQAGRCGEAVPRFALSIAARPEEPAGYGKLGVCFLELGSYEEARGTFEELRRRDPAANEASNGLGAVALLTGKPGEARAYYQETLGRDPWNVAAHRALAALDEPADPAAALAHCEAIAQVAPATPGNEDCISRIRARLAAGGSGR